MKALAQEPAHLIKIVSFYVGNVITSQPLL